MVIFKNKKEMNKIAKYFKERSLLFTGKFDNKGYYIIDNLESFIPELQKFDIFSNCNIRIGKDPNFECKNIRFQNIKEPLTGDIIIFEIYFAPNSLQKGEDILNAFGIIYL